jgi:uroporphyrinogen-III synthase
MRYKIPESLKYFCQSEAIAFYLQKYVVYRKRKIYVGQKDFVDLSALIKKYKDEKFLLPASDQLNTEIPNTLNNLKVDWTHAIFYKTVMSDLSDLADVYYDILAFFSPTGIKSLFKNFPDFEQNNTRIAVFGSTTQKEALDHGLRVDIMAPTPESPSMTMALEKYIAKTNKESKEK